MQKNSSNSFRDLFIFFGLLIGAGFAGMLGTTACAFDNGSTPATFMDGAGGVLIEVEFIENCEEMAFRKGPYKVPGSDNLGIVIVQPDPRRGHILYSTLVGLPYEAPSVGDPVAVMDYGNWVHVEEYGTPWGASSFPRYIVESCD